MDRKKNLDLESKKGKAPGGFNYPLYESGFPFIYMNAVGSFRDIVTMIHEGGHAIHSVLSHKLELTDFKGLTSEIAELASMSMELISMDNWDVFFDNKEDLKRAKRDQLMDILGTLPWVATIDKFQHWVYTHKNHSVAERNNYWLSLTEEFSSEQVDWTGLEKFKAKQWQRQLHLYEVPFYYIEYGMAQLGAVAMWRNYKKDPNKTIQQYKNALSLGYTKSIGEIYEAAGIKFDFSNEYVQELSQFIYEELQKTFKD
jgi:oligoendopeptidase F